MENNQELFKQAILDAKAVRETAMAAARTTLAEHFEPFIKQSMQETLSEEDMDDPVEESMDSKGGDLQDTDLEEILAELNALAESDTDLEEGHVPEDGYVGKKSKGQTGYDQKAKASHGDHKLHEAEEDDADIDDDAEEAGEAPVGDEAPDRKSVV